MERVARLAALQAPVPLHPIPPRRELLSRQIAHLPRQRHGLHITEDQVC